MDDHFDFTNLFKYLFSLMCFPMAYFILGFFMGDIQFEKAETEPLFTRCSFINLDHKEKVRHIEKDLRSKNIREEELKDFIKKLKEKNIKYDLSIQDKHQMVSFDLINQDRLQRTTISFSFKRNAHGVLQLYGHTPFFQTTYHWIMAPFVWAKYDNYDQQFSLEYDNLVASMP